MPYVSWGAAFWASHWGSQPSVPLSRHAVLRLTMSCQCPVGHYHPSNSIFASFQSQSASREGEDVWNPGQPSAWLQPTFQEADEQVPLEHICPSHRKHIKPGKKSCVPACQNAVAMQSNWFWRCPECGCFSEHDAVWKAVAKSDRSEKTKGYPECLWSLKTCCLHVLAFITSPAVKDRGHTSCETYFQTAHILDDSTPSSHALR